MTLLSRGQAYLNSALGQAGGVAVAYTRGENSVTIANAWVGRTAFKQLPHGASKAAVIWGDRDYLIPAADLVLGGLAVEPARGDRITEGSLVFEVIAPGGEPAWRWSDPQRTRYRVHCKQVTPA